MAIPDPDQPKTQKKPRLSGAWVVLDPGFNKE